MGSRSDPFCPETLLLKKKYTETHKELTMIFKRKDWLDIILTQFEEEF